MAPLCSFTTSGSEQFLYELISIYIHICWGSVLFFMYLGTRCLKNTLLIMNFNSKSLKLYLLIFTVKIAE